MESFPEENGIRNGKNEPKMKRVSIDSYHKHFIIVREILSRFLKICYFKMSALSSCLVVIYYIILFFPLSKPTRRANAIITMEMVPTTMSIFQAAGSLNYLIR